MSVRLADVIAVLDEAYPPGLAHDWDSVGLVCGDPNDTVDTVTVAVDATAAVVDTVGPRGLLLAHHPLLLRGVDTVATGSAKGALIHRLIRAGSALFTAHTNADAARAQEVRIKVERAGLKTYTHVADTKEGRRTRVRVGPFATKAEADRVAEKIRRLELPAAILTL